MCDGMQYAGCWLALPCPALQWWQLDFECISFALEVYLTTLFSDIFCFSDFFCDGTGQMDRGTDTGTDRLFSENIILEDYKDIFLGAGRSVNGWQIGRHWLAGNFYFPRGRIFISFVF